MMVIDFLKSIKIGKRCDGGVSDVRIDVSAWRKMYPELTDYRIEVTSPDKVVYIADTRMEGDVLIWDIRQSDTATEGRGEFQVVATGADGQRKTAGPADVTVARIMDGTAQDTPPDYAKPWLDSVNASANRAEAAANRAKQEVLDGLAEAKQSGEFDGKDGISPLVTVADIDGGHRVTITDKDGEKQFDVMDGKDGEGTGGGIPEGAMVIKKAVFTDRPSLWEWIQANWQKAFRAMISTADGLTLTNLSVFSLPINGTISFVQFHDTVVNASKKTTDFFGHSVRINNIEATMSTKACVRVSATGEVIGEGSTDYAQIPDEYWAAMGITVTVYYFE